MSQRRFARHLDSLPRAVVRKVERQMYAAGEMIAVAAQISITEGAVSGAGHVPSKPGQAPNNDTGVLADGIEVRQSDRLKIEVVSTADYSVSLEFGTSRIQARPFMAPAANRTRARVNAMLAGAARRAVREHFRKG